MEMEVDKYLNVVNVSLFVSMQIVVGIVAVVGQGWAFSAAVAGLDEVWR